MESDELLKDEGSIDSLSVIKSDLEQIISDPEMPNEQKVAIALRRVEAHVSFMESFSGPMPSPRMMQAYEKIIPGAAERIMKTYEEQHRHRINLESKAVPEQLRQGRRGQIYALILSLGLILLTGYCVFKEANLVALGTTIIAIVSLVGLFITGKYMTNQDLKRKSEDN